MSLRSVDKDIYCQLVWNQCLKRSVNWCWSFWNSSRIWKNRRTRNVVYINKSIEQCLHIIVKTVIVDRSRALKCCNNWTRTIAHAKNINNPMVITVSLMGNALKQIASIRMDHRIPGKRKSENGTKNSSKINCAKFRLYKKILSSNEFYLQIRCFLSGFKRLHINSLIRMKVDVKVARKLITTNKEKKKNTVHKQFRNWESWSLIRILHTFCIQASQFTHFRTYQ